MSEINTEMVKELFEEQFASWEQANNNYKALDGVLVKEIQVDGFPFKVQFNPARIVSSAAKVDAKSIQERKCFLCKENRPAVQRGIDFLYKGKDHYTVCKPFPDFFKASDNSDGVSSESAYKRKVRCYARACKAIVRLYNFLQRAKVRCLSPQTFSLPGRYQGIYAYRECSSQNEGFLP